MRIETKEYAFELPERWKGLVGVKRTKNRTNLLLLREEDPACSGLLFYLKCVKRPLSKPDEYTGLLGFLREESSGERRFLYVVYGREGAVSEENEDLYWRLRDRDWQLFESIRPAEGWRFDRKDRPADRLT